MSRLLILMSALAIAAAIPFSHQLLAGKQDRVTICHRIGMISNGLPAEQGGNCISRFGDPVDAGHQCGIVLEMNGNALGGHCRHGDRGVADFTPGVCDADFEGEFPATCLGF